MKATDAGTYTFYVVNKNGNDHFADGELYNGQQEVSITIKPYDPIELNQPERIFYRNEGSDSVTVDEITIDGKPGLEITEEFVYDGAWHMSEISSQPPLFVYSKTGKDSGIAVGDYSATYTPLENNVTNVEPIKHTVAIREDRDIVVPQEGEFSKEVDQPLTFSVSASAGGGDVKYVKSGIEEKDNRVTTDGQEITIVAQSIVGREQFHFSFGRDNTYKSVPFNVYVNTLPPRQSGS